MGKSLIIKKSDFSENAMFNVKRYLFLGLSLNTKGNGRANNAVKPARATMVVHREFCEVPLTWDMVEEGLTDVYSTLYITNDMSAIRVTTKPSDYYIAFVVKTSKGTTINPDNDYLPCDGSTYEINLSELTAPKYFYFTCKIGPEGTDYFTDETFNDIVQYFEIVRS